MSEKKRHSPNEGDYEVGYGRPPAHMRFQSGRSGNPKGHPKGSKNFSTLLAEELTQPITLTENGKRKRMSKQQALVKQLTNKALSNDLKATALVLDETRRMETPAEGSAAINFERPEDKLVMENIVRRIRKAAEPFPAEADMPPEKSEDRR